MVVDDEPLIRTVLGEILKSHDLEVVCQAGDGAEAVRKARQFKPDLVLMDIKMPVMNGFEAARLIMHEQPEISILMLTQYQSAAFAREAAAAGASGYVSKGGASVDLLAAIQKACARHLENQGSRTPAAHRRPARI